MVTREQVLDILRTIDDPEMPISIVDLGIIENVRVAGRDVAVDVLPTFVGCPALPVIEEEIQRRLRANGDIGKVQVRFLFDPAWTVDRISPAGRERLRQVGLSVPGRETETTPVQCPFCGSERVTLESSFGPTRCRMIYQCEACKHPFEHLKRVPLGTLAGSS